MAKEDNVSRDVYKKLHERFEAENNLLLTLKRGDDEDELDKSITDCENLRVREDRPIYQKGLHTRKQIQWLEQELNTAIKKKDKEHLEETIVRVKASGVEKYLQELLEKAEETLKERYAESPRFRRPVIGMSKTAMAELRTYKQASLLVHRVMTATLLLLGEDEQKNY